MVEVSEEMARAVLVAFDYVTELLEDHADAVLLVEQRFEIPVESAPGEVFGTNDVCVFVPSMRTLHVIDYKHGAGKFVDVVGNKQLRFYGLGALAHVTQSADKFGATPLALVGRKDIDSVALTIIQPRVEWAEPIRTEWISVEELLAFGPVIGEAVRAAKAPDAPLVPGEEQCMFCAARWTCPAREAAVLEAVGSQFAHVQDVRPDALPKPKTLEAERLAATLRLAPIARAFFKDCEEEARGRLRDAPMSVPGWKLVEAQARREWEGVDEEDPQTVWTAAYTLANIAEPDSAAPDPRPFTKMELRGLGEVEKILKDSVPAGLARNAARDEKARRLAAMALLTTKRSSGNLTLAPEDDHRPAVDRSARAFADVVAIPHVKLED